MNLKEFDFLDNEIEEYEGLTPKEIKDVINDHSKLVGTNISYLKNLGVETYKEIFINYPDMFLMDASNFEGIFSKYQKEELVAKLNTNYKMVKRL